MYFKELGITYSFPYNSYIGAYDKLYLAGNSLIFQQYYGFLPFGEFTRNMSNKSEKLVLADAFGNIIDYVEYQDSIPWPQSADGTGDYLQLVNPNYDNSIASSWIASNQFIGIDETAINDGLHLYPIPARSIVTVDRNAESIKSYGISDLTGRMLHHVNDVNSKTVTIPVDDLLPGTYLIRFVFDNGTESVRKIIKI